VAVALPHPANNQMVSVRPTICRNSFLAFIFVILLELVEIILICLMVFDFMILQPVKGIHV
jgi:hypothetical protein